MILIQIAVQFLSHNREWARLRGDVCRAWNVAAGGMGHDYFGKQNSACAIRRAPNTTHIQH